jgi:hypothetical protein
MAVDIFRRQSSSQHPNRPDFLCIGMQKAGTGWLYAAFKTHAEIFVSPIKELHYFHGNFRPARAGARLAEMSDQHEPGRDSHLDSQIAFLRIAASSRRINDRMYGRLWSATDRPIAGELTPSYSMLSIDEIAHVNKLFPQLKLLLLIRNPVDRAWGQMNMQWRRGKIPTEKLTTPNRVAAYLRRSQVEGRSFPSLTYQRWRTSFAAEQIHVASLDDIIGDPEQMLRSCLEFLGADARNRSFSVPENAKRRHKKVTMSSEVEAILVDHFAEETERCRSLFHVDWPVGRLTRTI